MTRLTLNRLGRAPTDAIVARLAGEQVLPPAARNALISARSGSMHTRDVTVPQHLGQPQPLWLPPSRIASMMSELAPRHESHSRPLAQDRVLIRGDSHYARNEAMTWCERNRVGYVFGLAGNQVLAARVADLAEDAALARAKP